MARRIPNREATYCRRGEKSTRVPACCPRMLSPHVSKLFRNVLILTSIKMSPFCVLRFVSPCSLFLLSRSFLNKLASRNPRSNDSRGCPWRIILSAPYNIVTSVENCLMEFWRSTPGEMKDSRMCSENIRLPWRRSTHRSCRDRGK